MATASGKLDSQWYIVTATGFGGQEEFEGGPICSSCGKELDEKMVFFPVACSEVCFRVALNGKFRNPDLIDFIVSELKATSGVTTEMSPAEKIAWDNYKKESIKTTSKGVSAGPLAN